MRLPIPIFHGDKVYPEVDITRPDNNALADTKRHVDRGDFYQALVSFLAGSVTAIRGDSEITDKLSIKSLVRHMPYRSAEVVAIKVLIEMDPEDGVEGVYPCPRCGDKVIAELTEENGETISDTRDFVSNLGTHDMPEPFERSFLVALEEVVEIERADNKEKIESVESLEMHHPTLGDCIAAAAKVGQDDQVRLNYSIWLEATEKANDSDLSTLEGKRWKSALGALVFGRIRNQIDRRAIAKEISKWGIDPEVTKHCRGCGKQFQVAVNTANFFGSGVRSNQRGRARTVQVG